VIVIDTSVFLDELFKFDQERHEKARIFFRLVQDRLIVEPEIYGIAFSIAFETGSRAIDSFYIAASKIKNAILVSNDKIQVESARKFGVEAYYLPEEFEKVKKRIRNRI